MSTTGKTCFKCNVEKPITAFYVHPAMGDGRLNKCKECTKRDVSKNYRDNIDHYVAYERERTQRPERRVAKLRYQQDRRTRTPGKARAHYQVSNAIRDGRLKREPCEKCGAKAQAHHDDYRKPLAVRWLCFKHHREHHGQVTH